MNDVFVTCIKNGRFDRFGRPLESGSSYTLSWSLARDLWLSGYVSVTDAAVFDSSSVDVRRPNLAAELAVIGAPVNYKFSGFTVGRLLASLAASSTATRVGLVVTVTATAHGIPSGTYDGADFFFPGCPSLAAGWYNNFLYLTANSLQFSLPAGTAGADFAGESVNGGAAYTTQTRVAALNLPINALQSGSRCKLVFYRQGSTGGASKFTYYNIGATQLGRISGTSSPSGFTAMTAACDGGRVRGLTNGNDAGVGAGFGDATVDYSTEIECSIDVSVSAAGEYNHTSVASVEIVK